MHTDAWHRGKGIAGKLLRKVGAEADKHGAVLVLMPDGAEWLPDWYEQHGFQTIQTDPAVIMARKPHVYYLR